MMKELVFSFLPSYFSIIFLDKGKISKSVSQSHRAKMVLANQIARFQIKYISRTKWWNSLFPNMMIPEIKNWWKNIGVVVVRDGYGHPGHKVNEWMNAWTELIFCTLIQIQESWELLYRLPLLQNYFFTIK